MNARLLLTIALVSPFTVASRTAVAQLTTPVFRELSAVGTPDEMPLVKAVSARLRSSFTGDAAFATKFRDALVRGKGSEARTLLAQVAQAPGAEVVIAVSKPTSALEPESRGLVHVATASAETRWQWQSYNPWWVMVTYDNWTACVGSECSAHLKYKGYTLVP